MERGQSKEEIRLVSVRLPKFSEFIHTVSHPVLSGSGPEPQGYLRGNENREGQETESLLLTQHLYSWLQVNIALTPVSAGDQTQGLIHTHTGLGSSTQLPRGLCFF